MEPGLDFVRGPFCHGIGESRQCGGFMDTVSLLDVESLSYIPEESY